MKVLPAGHPQSYPGKSRWQPSGTLWKVGYTVKSSRAHELCHEPQPTVRCWDGVQIMRAHMPSRMGSALGLLSQMLVPPPFHQEARQDCTQRAPSKAHCSSLPGPPMAHTQTVVLLPPATPFQCGHPQADRTHLSLGHPPKHHPKSPACPSAQLSLGGARAGRVSLRTDLTSAPPPTWAPAWENQT